MGHRLMKRASWYRRDFLALCASVASLPSAGLAASSQPRAGPAGAWQEDLDFLYQQLAMRHRNLFNRTPRQAFDRAVALLRVRIPELPDNDVITGLQEIAALAGDGHTFVFAWERLRSLPFDTEWFGDEVRVTRATPAASALLGFKIERIDGMEMAEVVSRLDRLIPQGENRWYVLAHRPNRLRRTGFLAALGIAKSTDGVTLDGVDREGRRQRIEVPASPLSSPDEAMTMSIGPGLPTTPDASFAWSRLADRGAVHLCFNNYSDLARKADALFAYLNKDMPDRLVIDMRQNGGGNYILARAYLIPLIQNSALNRAGRLFVLVGRRTFSAAMVTALDFRRETEALLVGEPVGARPNSYQELQTFDLPNSKLRVACAVRRYRFADDDVDAVRPDVVAPPTWSAYATGQDDALEAALRTST
jgi:Peptidase family S41